MSDSTDDIRDTMTYPTVEQRDRWDERADKLDMNTSEFVKNMVEAGMKADQGFETSVDPDEPARELREHRNELQDQLEQAEERIRSLNRGQHITEQEAILRYVEDNPGTDFDSILSHLRETLPGRVNRILDTLEGSELRAQDDEYHRHTAGSLLDTERYEG